MILSGSVRADLFGGTLDLDPIGLILGKAKTLNLALSLQATVQINESTDENFVLTSKDYGTERKVPFSHLEKTNALAKDDPLYFLWSLVADLKPQKALAFQVSSKAPPGSGLGGSSSLGVVFYKALSDYLKMNLDRQEIIKRVKNIEAIILNSGPTGFQDYYPALYGGVLSLHMDHHGIELEQLYNPELKEFLEKHLMLVYSGQTRFSGINNWEVYKGFFDKSEAIVQGFEKLAAISSDGHMAIKSKSYADLISIFKKEAETRANLFPAILTEQMKKLEAELENKAFLKICGAGGGGCFLLIMKDPSDRTWLQEKIQAKQMQELEFAIMEPMSAN